MLSLLELPFDEVLVDLVRAEQRTEAHLSRNPLGQVPVLVDGDATLWESHATILYLAARYGADAWIPREPYSQYLVNRWLFVDSNELHNGIGFARNGVSFGAPLDVPSAQRSAKGALAVMDLHLRDRAWLELGCATLADVACYPLVSVVTQAGLDLSAFPNVAAWLRRVRALPGFVETPWPPVA
jgi:glutathione S-transferase